ncbi:hypothetical protein EWE75_15765 [Sphingomonas populi]|uniref:Uncharacterized protein n=1 Tax=Sphingomonas populi TaxID=2484750 RepID=A0A4Q6Y1B5_9SPHN|nr:hypothetical protein [Sphingomonas populi]RZF63494.1 hypothetical protein EWE75_15765 [Sphingomonas populi]
MHRTPPYFLIGIIAVFVGLPLYWWAFPPRLPIGAADGTYANPCCEPIKLHNGQMTFGHSQTISYVVEYDKVSPYVLPSAYVGISGGKAVQIERSISPSFLRLADTSRSETIELPSDTAIFTFKRVKTNGR